MGDEFVPGFAGAHVENNFAVFIVTAVVVDTSKSDFQDQARPTGIGDQQVASAAEDEQWQIPRTREGDCFLHLPGIAGLDEKPRRASDFEGGELRQRNVFEQKHE